ncbi:MAG: hypothetical protein ACREPX_11925, partial [Rhodanobacteraceae bacterium]
TEIVLKLPRRLRKANADTKTAQAEEAMSSAPPAEESAGTRRGPPYPRARGGSSGRAAAGAMRIANSVGAAIADRRVLGQSESGLLLIAGAFLFACAIVGIFWPRIVAWPLAALAIWIGLSLVAQYFSAKKRGPS